MSGSRRNSGLDGCSDPIGREFMGQREEGSEKVPRNPRTASTTPFQAAPAFVADFPNRHEQAFWSGPSFALPEREYRKPWVYPAQPAGCLTSPFSQRGLELSAKG
jgi:hypothetical protein